MRLGQSMLATVAIQIARNSRGAAGGNAASKFVAGSMIEAQELSSTATSTQPNRTKIDDEVCLIKPPLNFDENFAAP